jgi:uncharacterized protein (TIGR02594 family)
MSEFSSITRRQFLARNSRIVGGLLIQSESAELQTDAYRDFNSGNLPDLRALGTNPATAEEVVKADSLLNAAPLNREPVNVLSYLESLPDQNVDGEAYRGGWKTRWNPLIVRFFDATRCGNTRCKPSGDMTPWCAASLNWVLVRCGYKGTKSDSSGSFRDPSKGLTTVPRIGDIAVFRSADEDEARVGHGHVGLFLDQTESKIQVLGGNQINHFGHHAISRQWISKSQGSLRFDSFHSVRAFY